jgi:glycosyltransferase involved in cell wall biosynthesis
VLVVTNHRDRLPDHAAAGIFIERQIRSLRQAGVDVHVFDLGRGHAPHRLAKKLIALRRTARELQPDVVHGRYGGLPGAFAVLAGRPSVITFGGGDLLLTGAKRRAYSRLAIAVSNLSALGASHLVCVSRELRDALWWQHRKTSVIPDGVDAELFVPGDQTRARAELGWPAGGRVVIADVARDPDLKGRTIVEEVVARAASVLPGLRLEVLERITPDRMPRYMQAADALLCASAREGSPNIIKEALACNLPVVSTPVGDVLERLRGVHPSALAEREPAALAAALVRVLRVGGRSNGRASVTDLGLEAIAKRVVEVYESVRQG